VYKSFSLLTQLELISLKQLFKFLGGHKIIYIGPLSLDYSSYLNVEFEHAQKLTYKTFDETNFSGISGYNKLLISDHFLDTFKKYSFILIYQLDAYVFDDQLTYWCKKGYDYIGAPKLRKKHVTGIGSIFQEPVLMNGGLSLRKVKPILRYIRYYGYFFKEWKANEDAMFSFAQRRTYPFRWLLKLPNWKEALAFSVEKNPQIGIKILGGAMPFGCHAWEKYNPKFWKSFIR
jgi:hypothetical protein